MQHHWEIRSLNRMLHICDGHDRICCVHDLHSQRERANELRASEQALSHWLAFSARSLQQWWWFFAPWSNLRTERSGHKSPLRAVTVNHASSSCSLRFPYVRVDTFVCLEKEKKEDSAGTGPAEGPPAAAANVVVCAGGE